MDSKVVHPYQRITVPHLIQYHAASTSRPSEIIAAVAIVLSGSKIKCEPDSQLDSVIKGNADLPLGALASKLSSASCAVDGRTYHLQSTFTPNSMIKANDLIASIMQRRPLLMEWRGSVYVLYGVVYDEHLYHSGAQDNIIRDFVLIDPRYSDSRRFVAFDREKNNFAEISGVATVSVAER